MSIVTQNGIHVHQEYMLRHQPERIFQTEN